MSSLLIQRYADAFSQAAEKDKASWQEAAKAFLTAWKDTPALPAAIGNTAYPVRQRADALKAVLQKLSAPAVMLRLTDVLADNNRLMLVSAIFRKAIEEGRRATEGSEAIITTATEADEQAQQELKKQAQALEPTARRFVFKVNPSLLGGFRLRYGSMLHDHSTRGRLRRLRAHLLND